PYTAASLAVLPGQPNSVAVDGSNNVVTVYDAGVARPNTSAGLGNFLSYYGAMAFGSSASTLYVASGSLYKLTVDTTGITASTQLQGGNVSGNTLQYDNGKLYSSSGLVFDGNTGAQIGQFSLAASFSTTPVPATGPIVSDSTLNRVWIVPFNYGNTNQLISFD